MFGAGYTVRYSTFASRNHFYSFNVIMVRINQSSMFSGNRLIGPFIYDQTLTGQRYLTMLRNEIVPAIMDVGEHEVRDVWFQHDGCPAHNSREVHTFLLDTFGGRIIANSGPVRWPARSPDLTPLDFYLWGYLKNELYEFDPPGSREILEQRVRDVLSSINRNTIDRVTRSVIKKCQKCLEVNGSHFIA